MPKSLKPEEPKKEDSPIGESDLFTYEELKIFYDALIRERKKILFKAQDAVKTGSIRVDTNELMDEVDLASVTIEQDLTFRMLDRERKLLAEIEHALTKIKDGSFGYCEGTGDPIPKRRLELTPWTRHSVKYKEQLEKREKAGGRGGVDENKSREDD